MRAAFISAFADGGLAWGPGPAPVREVWPKLPPQKDPLARLLEWAPEAAFVASSGDLGATTGPFRMTDRATGKLLTSGWFFSVWRRDAGGAWKVIADMGVDAPADAPPPLSVEAVRIWLEPRPASCPVPALAGLRVHRDGRPPATGEAACAVLAGEERTFAVEGEIASGAGDLRYTRGTWTSPAEAAAVGKKGFFVRVWRRAPSTSPAAPWLLAADIQKSE